LLPAAECTSLDVCTRINLHDLKSSIRGNFGDILKDASKQLLPIEEILDYFYPPMRPAESSFIGEHDGCIFDFDALSKRDKFLIKEITCISSDVFVGYISHNGSEFRSDSLCYFGLPLVTNERIEKYIKVLITIAKSRRNPKFGKIMRKLLIANKLINTSTNT
jgi:hypothetical protein